MNVALFGLPGSGKGTLAALLQERLGLLPISTGDLLRAAAKAEGPLGEALRQLPVGSFAPDELVLRVLTERAARPDCQSGIILDGVPRTLAQARALADTAIAPDVCVHLLESEEVVIERALNRLWHPASGRVYNLKSKPPRAEGVDDVTGEPLERRKDDQRDILAARCQDFREKTLPAVEHFRETGAQKGRRFIEVAAGTPLEEVAFALESLHLELSAKKGLRAPDAETARPRRSPGL